MIPHRRGEDASLALVLLLVLTAAPKLRAQAEPDVNAPYSMEELLRLISSPTPEARVAQLVTQGCIAFALDAFRINDLRQAGASLELIGVLRRACFVDETNPTPPPPMPLMSPALTFAHSLVIPGSGQFRTNRAWRGGLVLVGSVGAIAYGLLSTTVTKQCREAIVGGECLSGQFTSVQTDRPRLVAGLAAAGVMTLVGAVDALLGARKINRERLGVTGRDGSGLSSGEPLPASPVIRLGDIRLLELRFR